LWTGRSGGEGDDGSLLTAVASEVGHSGQKLHAVDPIRTPALLRSHSDAVPAPADIRYAVAGRQDHQLLERAGAFAPVGRATLGHNLIEVELGGTVELRQTGKGVGPGSYEPGRSRIRGTTGRRLDAGAGGKDGKEGKEEAHEA
jgi:hypothetical protein